MWEASGWAGVCAFCAIVLVGCGEDGESSTGGGSGGSGGSGGTPVASGGSVPSSGGVASSDGSVTASGGSAGSGGGGAGGASAGGSSASGGNAGSTGGASSATCSPITEAIQDDTIYDLPRCELGLESGVTNPTKARVDDIPLAAPLPAGVMHAVNLTPLRGNTAGNAEIWGATTPCGPVTELLWFGPILGGQQCAEFTPTKDVMRLMIVTREMEPLNVSFFSGIGEVVTICSNGACPNGKNGQGRSPGATLVSPSGAYEYSGSGWFGGYQFTIGTLGWMLPVYAPGQTRENGKLSAVPFRAPPADPYGDSWYIGGAGSTILEAYNSSSYFVDIKAVRRLPSCADLDGAGTATFKWTRFTGPANGTSTSSLPDLAGPELHVDGSCAGTRCSIGVVSAGTNHTTHLFIAVDGDLRPRNSPASTTAKVLEATWFSVPEAPTPLAVTCSTSGTVTYTPEGESVITLNALGPLVPATGTAVTPDSVRFGLDWQ